MANGLGIIRAFPICLGLFLTGLATLSSAGQAGLADPGMVLGRARTAYDFPRLGTPDRPITLLKPFPTDDGCLFDSASDDILLGLPCQTGPLAYGDMSNAFGQRGGWRDGPPFWIVDINNEPAFDACNPGPPHLSLPLRRPGEGLAGFRMQRAGPAWAAHLALSLGFENPCGASAIPFLSVGAREETGNGMPVAFANQAVGTAPHRLQFTINIEAFESPATPDGGDGAAFVSVLAVAQWRDIPRMLYINLLHFNRDIAPPGSLGRVWNWPVAEHYFYPGADIAYFDAEHVDALCGISIPELAPVAGTSIRYSLKLHRLFRCASRLGLFRDRMPNRHNAPNLPIQSVHWAIEAQGSEGQVWISVHDPHMAGTE